MYVFNILTKKSHFNIPRQQIIVGTSRTVPDHMIAGEDPEIIEVSARA